MQYILAKVYCCRRGFLASSFAHMLFSFHAIGLDQLLRSVFQALHEIAFIISMQMLSRDYKRTAASLHDTLLHAVSRKRTSFVS